MTDTRKLEMVKFLMRLFDETSVRVMVSDVEFADIMDTLEGFRDELEPKQYQVGERVEYKFYGNWVRATVEKIGKVRVGIQIKDFPAEIKYVSAKMLKKVEAK